MTSIETIGIHFMGYNLMHTATREVQASLRMISGETRQTGLTTQEWALKSEQAANRIALAEARYADVVKSTNVLVVNAAQDQAAAFKLIEAAHLKIAEAAVLRADAENDLALISSRAYALEQDRIDLLDAANMRLTKAMGLRAIAEQQVIDATMAMATADEAAARVANEAAAKQASAATVVKAAYAAQARSAQESAMAQISSMRSAATAIVGVGAAFEIAGVVTVAAMGYAASKAADFASEIYILHTQARVAKEQLPELSRAILDMAGSMGFGSTELAKGLYLIESVAGGSYTAAHALDILKAAAMGAAVGHSDLVETANALASVMAVYPTIVGGPVAAMGALDAIVGQGKMTMEELNGALKTGVLATLHSSGISLQDFGGALATMTDYSIPAIQAANSLRMAIYLMTAPTQASDKVLREFGLTSKEVSSVSKEWTTAIERAGIRHAQLADDLRKPGGIIIALQDLRSHLVKAGLDAEGQAEVIYKAFGGGKMGKAVLTLYENIAGGAGASEAELLKLGFTTDEVATLHDRLIGKTASINQQTQLLGQNFKYIQDTDPAQMWKQFTSELNATIIALGGAFIPILIALLKTLTPMLRGMTQWILDHKQLTMIIAGSIAGLSLLIGTALLVVGAIAGIGLAIAGLAFIGPEMLIVALAFAGLMAVVADVVGAIVFLGTIWSSLANLWDTRVVPTATKLWNIIGDIWKIITDGIAKTQPLWTTAFDDLNTRLNTQGSAWDTATKAFQNFGNEALKFIKSETFAAMIATFSVSLPVAFGLTIDSLFLLEDTAEIAFTALYYAGKLAVDFFSGNFAQLVKDGAEGTQKLSAINDRWAKDSLKLYEDMGKLVDGTYDRMWQDIYNSTMQWTAKLGDDGAPAMQSALEKVMNSGKTAMAAGEKRIYNEGYLTGQNMANGMAAGMDSRSEAIQSHANTLVTQALAAAKKASKSSSPSRLFAEDVGKTWPQGIWMGVEEETPRLEKNMQSMTTNLARNFPNFEPKSSVGEAFRPSESSRSSSSSTTVSAETNIKLMLDEEVLARVTDRQIHEILNGAYSV